LVQGSGSRVQGSGFRVQNSSFRIQGSAPHLLLLFLLYCSQDQVYPCLGESGLLLIHIDRDSSTKRRLEYICGEPRFTEGEEEGESGLDFLTCAIYLLALLLPAFLSTILPTRSLTPWASGEA
jgi:hypothetical protein